MSGLFTFLFLITLGLLIISLVKPGFLNKLIKRELSRKQSSLGISAILLILFVLIGITAPPVEKKDNSQVAGESISQEVSPTPTIEPSSTPEQLATPEPSLTPTSDPTEIPTPKPSPTPVKKPSPTPAIQSSQSTTNSGCDPSYPDVCIPPGAADYDCAGGSGNGPNYINGPIRVLPPDPHDLDRDGDGIGCEK